MKKKYDLDESLAKFNISYDKRYHAYKIHIQAKEMYTVFAKFPGDNFYSEEIDVLVDGVGPGAEGEAIEITKRVIAWGYDPKLVPCEVVHRPKGTMFF